jgi:hypothetical protein
MLLKAEREEVVALEGRQGLRMAALEGAILKGLRAISDKVSAALAQKLDLDKFSEFKVQVGPPQLTQASVDQGWGDSSQQFCWKVGLGVCLRGHRSQ